MRVWEMRKLRMHSAYGLVAAGTLLCMAGAFAQTAKTGAVKKAERAARPKLVVLLVVDQMRGDYVDKFRGQWSGGLQRLVTQGAWFRAAAYPYAATETCVGHSTISTGSFPASHGMVANGWWDRDQQKMTDLHGGFEGEEFRVCGCERERRGFRVEDADSFVCRGIEISDRRRPHGW